MSRRSPLPPGAADADCFPTDPAGLPEAATPRVMELADGAAIDLRIGPVAKRLGEATVRMLAYNGSVPGPVLRVRQGSELTVHVLNEGDTEATVHWHGLRLENRHDGTHETQAPIPIGGRHTYRLTFPDPGAYWYHPHIREDYNQELGLHGTIVVVPDDPDYWPPAHRELSLTLDDILLDGGRVARFRRSTSSYTAMGRFGDLLLVNGEPQPSLAAAPGEVVRLYLTCTANTRVFNVGIRGARMKLVGGDGGRRERERMVDAVTLAPSERAVVDVLFAGPGEAVLEHRTPGRTRALARIDVSGAPARPHLEDGFDELRVNAEMAAERGRIAPMLGAEPDKTLAFVAEMDMGGHEGAHPHDTHEHGRRHGGHGHGHGEHGAHAGAEGIEWEDDMVAHNRMTTPATMRWRLVDRGTGAEGHDIDWTFRVGDRVKLRLVNEMDSDHPMHHPFHVHGAGRFLVLSRDGVPEDDLVWKDTVLVPTGRTVDLLLEVTNPGRWMAHCHIAEHHEAGMTLSFTVEP